MSRFKIVKKHGRLEKRAVHRSPSFVSWKEKLVRAAVGRLSWMTPLEEQLEKALADDEFVIWTLLLLVQDLRRQDNLCEFVMIQHDGRGVQLTMYADDRRSGIVFRQQAIYSAHRRLAEWVNLGWEKLKGWGCVMDTALMTGWDPPLVLRITLYPPNGSNFHAICKKMWVEGGPRYAPSAMDLMAEVYKRFT